MREKATVSRALVPKDYLRGPVFAARKQTGGRVVQIGEKTYEIGGFSPLGTRQVCPALDMRHGRAAFTMLGFRRLEDGETIRFSINAFCHAYAASQGGRYARDVREIITDLMNCFIRVRNPDGSASSYRILERVKIDEKPIRRRPKNGGAQQTEFWMDEVRMSPEFYRLLCDLSQVAHIRVDVLNRIASPIAQAIYTYIPSRAVHHKARESAFEITLSTLLGQIGQSVPPTPSQRKQVFTQHEKTLAGSVMMQLDGAETLSHVLRVALEKTADGSDWKLLAWVDPLKAATLAGASARADERKPGALKKAWLASGRSEADFAERLRRIEPLTDYQRELLTAGRINADGSVAFFEMAKALLGAVRFESLLGEAKGVIAEAQDVENPTGLLIARIVEAVGVPVRK